MCVQCNAMGHFLLSTQIGGVSELAKNRKMRKRKKKKKEEEDLVHLDGPRSLHRATF